MTNNGHSVLCAFSSVRPNIVGKRRDKHRERPEGDEASGANMILTRGQMKLKAKSAKYDDVSFSFPLSLCLYLL